MKEEIKRKGIEVETVEESRKGDLIIMMGHKSKGVEDLRKGIQDKFSGARVKTMGDGKGATIILSRMDMEVTVEEIQVALKEAGVNGESKVTDIRPMHSSYRKATIEMSEEDAVALSWRGRVRVGLNVCIVRRIIKVEICHKYLGAGHYYYLF